MYISYLPFLILFYDRGSFLVDILSSNIRSTTFLLDKLGTKGQSRPLPNVPR